MERISSLSEPLLLRAKEAFKVCLATSTRSRHFDETSAGCERWLSSNYRGELHALDEIFAAPSKVSATILARPAVPEG